MIERKRVAVVGAGATGLTAALALARRGLEAVVFEAKPELQPTPRGNTLHPATLMLFERLGVVDDVVSIGQRADGFQYRELLDGVIAEFDLNSLADVTPYPFKLHCAQDQLTRVLFEHVRAAKIAVEFASRVVEVVQSEHSARIRVQKGQHFEELEVAYLVAADGSSSKIRDAVGITFEGESRPTRLVQIMTTYDLARAWSDIASEAYFMDPASPCVITQAPESWRILLALPDHITDRDLLRGGWHRDALSRIFALDRPISIFHETMYAIRTGIASTFRAKRVFLVGDAAHVVLPFAAMGLNCGIHDAYFLAKALYDEAILAKCALDGWAATRRTFALNRVIAESKAFFELLRAPESERGGRNAQLRQTAGDAALARAYMLRSIMLDGAPPDATT